MLDSDIIIKPFMLEDLKLEGKELLIYAILYDAKKYGVGYTGDLELIARKLNIQKKTLFESMKKLHEKGLIDKVAITIGNEQRYAYFAVNGENKIASVKKKTNPRTDEVKEVFDYWKEVRGKDSRVALNDTRRVKIRARLDKFSVEDIKQAIDNIAYSAYHNGLNEQKRVYDDIELICRNDGTLEKWLLYKNNSPKRHFLAVSAVGILEEEQMTEERLLWLEAIQYIKEVDPKDFDVIVKNGAEVYNVGNYVYMISKFAREDYGLDWVQEDIAEREKSWLARVDE